MVPKYHKNIILGSKLIQYCLKPPSGGYGWVSSTNKILITSMYVIFVLLTHLIREEKSIQSVSKGKNTKFGESGK